MRIAFTSCFDALDDPVQNVWTTIAGHHPDVLLLLGDSVYMDFGLTGERELGWPRKVSDQEFADTLYSRYRAQWQVTSFRDLVRSGIRVANIWDDHDFAWNDSRGASKAKHYGVSPSKQRISRKLCLQFRSVLQDSESADTYPAMPELDELLALPDGGIQYTLDHEGVLFVMLDGRSFRQDPSPQNPEYALMHGMDQLQWLDQELHNWAGYKIIGAGSVLSGSSECWTQYYDYDWLIEHAPERVIVLTGDIHDNRKPVDHRHFGAPLYEITASGAARPGPFNKHPRLFGASGNFGLLDLGETVSATLYGENSVSGPHILHF